jgi:hypothetical protein
VQLFGCNERKGDERAEGDPKMMRQASMLLTDAAAHNKDMSHCHAKDKDAHFLVLRYANTWKPSFMHPFSYTQPCN